MERTYHIIDLREIQEFMEEHWNPVERDDILGQCACGEMVTQDQTRCNACGLAIVWRGSRRWKNLFGNPEQAIRKLSLVQPWEMTSQYLADKAGIIGFNQADSEAWKKALRHIAEKDLISAIDFCYDKGDRGHGLLRHAMNIAARKTREELTKKRQRRKQVTQPDTSSPGEKYGPGA